MTLLISYDITNNRLRKKLSDYLLYLGLNRVQKSVFIGYANRSIKRKAGNKSREIMEMSEDEQDKIFILPIHLKSLNSSIFMGEYQEELIKEITGKVKVRIY